MTLSRFLRDCIYIPLGGNRKGNARTYINLLSTFLIGGLWHGAGWTFIFWGFLHGIALIIHRVWSNFGFKMWTWLAWFITFNFVNIAWIFFRAKEWDDAVKVLGGMFSLQNIVLPDRLESKLSFLTNYNIKFGGLVENIQGDDSTPIWLILGFILTLFFKNSMEKWKEFRTSLFGFLITMILLIVSLGVANEFSEFLYFNF